MTEQQKPDTYTLLDAVDELSLPQHRKQTQDVLEHGHVVGQQRVGITLPPLLTQLAEAIAGTIGADAGSKNLASERSVLDADALYKFIKIDALIRDWCRGQKIIPGKDPAANLRAWYVAQMQREQAPEVDAFHIKQLGSWAGQIRAKLDPWRERELDKDSECPTCGAKSFWRDGHEYLRPLIVRYKPTGPDLIQDARVLCRACEATFGVRELAFELEKQAAAREDPKNVA